MHKITIKYLTYANKGANHILPETIYYTCERNLIIFGWDWHSDKIFYLLKFMTSDIYIKGKHA